MKKIFLLLIFGMVGMYAQDRFDELEQRIEKLEKEKNARIKKLEQKVQQLEKDKNKLTKKVETLEQKNKDIPKLKSEIDKIKRHSKLKKYKDELAKEVEELREDHDVLEDDYESFLESFEKRVELHGYAVFDYIDRRSANSSLRDLSEDEKAENTFRINEFELQITVPVSDWARLYTELEFSPSEDFQLENLWIEIEPLKNLKLRFGKFFTYYGEWNRIHRRALLPIFDDILLQKNEIFDSESTGLEIEYKYEQELFTTQFVLWIANGKGLQEDVFDDNNNKAIGARIAIESEQLGIFKEFRAGVSGYLGKVEKALTDPFTLDANSFPDLVFTRENDNLTPQEFSVQGYTAFGEPVDSYRDQALAFHLKGEFYNFLFWSEYVVNFVKPKEARIFTEYGYFFLLGYELDVADVFGKNETTETIGRFFPFIAYEGYEANTHLRRELGSSQRLLIGLDWKPIPYVIFKIEYQRNIFPRGEFRDFDAYVSQLILAF